MITKVLLLPLLLAPLFLDDELYVYKFDGVGYWISSINAEPWFLDFLYKCRAMILLDNPKKTEAAKWMFIQYYLIIRLNCRDSRNNKHTKPDKE